MERRKRTDTVKALQQHEASPPQSVRREIQALKKGDAVEDLFSETDPKKRELYALLGMVIADAWTEVERRLTDPATQTERSMLKESTREVVHLSRPEVEREMERAFSISDLSAKLFSHYRALFQEALLEQEEEVRGATEAAQRVRVHRRLQDLMKEGVHAVVGAQTVTEEVMAGLGTANRVMNFVVSAVPDVFRERYRRPPTYDEWMQIVRNSEKLILTVASKALSRFIQMGHIFRREDRAVKTSQGGIWNEQLFELEGEGEQQSLGVQDGPLASLLMVRDMPAPDGKGVRVGCPALYVDVISPLYQAWLRDIDVYLKPHYVRLTEKKGYYD